MAAKLISTHEHLKDDSGQARGALFYHHACHVKSVQKGRKYHLKHLIYSHSNQEQSLTLYSSVCLQQRQSLLIDARDRGFLDFSEESVLG